MTATTETTGTETTTIQTTTTLGRGPVLGQALSLISDTQLRSDAARLCARNEETALLLERVVAYFVSKPPPTRTIQTKPTSVQLGSHVFTVDDHLPFSNPRKRLFLTLYQEIIMISSAATTMTTTAQEEQSASIPLSNITAILILPTPAKQKPNFTIAIFFSSPPLHSTLGTLSSPLLLSFDDTGSPMSVSSMHDAYTMDLSKTQPKKDAWIKLLGAMKQEDGRPIPLFQPNPSIIPANPPGKLGTNGCGSVAAHVQMREGHLFFLPQCLFFGFKKPCTLVALSLVRWISFGCITSRTFSLHVHHTDANSDTDTREAVEEFVVEMIDKVELEALVAYFKGRGVGIGEESYQGKVGLAKAKPERVVLLGGGELDLTETDEKDEGLNCADSDEDDGDFVGDSDGEDADEELDEEYDSDHQTDGESSDDDDDDGEDNEDGSGSDLDEGGDKKGASHVDDNDDIQMMKIGIREPPSNLSTRKRRAEESGGGVAKRKYVAPVYEIGDDNEVGVISAEGSDDEDIDELEL
ncbi:hypothetical protein BC830DRAFT_578599 [Chytriomyces sp. MP71]|nr:hypothetical protein BC830DRAFT_578599 [Chytriomyces sp. MP71]